MAVLFFGEHFQKHCCIYPSAASNGLIAAFQRRSYSSRTLQHMVLQMAADTLKVKISRSLSMDYGSITAERRQFKRTSALDGPVRGCVSLSRVAELVLSS
jgi:hypothetical protein